MKKIDALLIANRGEIASRIIRTCRKMGIRSVAVFSDADQDSPYVSEADKAIYIGGSAPVDSYLNQDHIIQAAAVSHVDAIHPGYGFLSENAAFAKRCHDEDFIFVGPHPEAIMAMGSKANAKELMISHGVPTVPGYQGADQSLEKLMSAAAKIGYPVLLKASAGGGGKGMRIVHQPQEIQSAIDMAKREAENAFGNGDMIIEKYVSSGRHIEFQIFGDQHGQAIHLFERECTIQRRYQKVIEESPSPIMSAELRARMGAAAVDAAKALNYDNAGTVEFIYDDQSGDFYFLEVNTRLQVEHPVTEEVTGLDLVMMQIESAQGLPLRIDQDEVKLLGYAVEARLYAEDATNQFLPVTGTIERFAWPEVDGLRVETAVKSGSHISIYYDPMIAKLIVWDETRQGAHRKMLYVLRHMVCLGMTTNQDFLCLLFEHQELASGDYDTHFIQNKVNLEDLESHDDQAYIHAAIAATLHTWQDRNNGRKLLRSLPSGWRNSFYQHQLETYTAGNQKYHLHYRAQEDGFEFIYLGVSYQVKLKSVVEDQLRALIDGILHSFTICSIDAETYVHHIEYGQIRLSRDERFPMKQQEKLKGGYESPMPSQVVSILVQPGQSVQAGEGLIILSSMKMENIIEAAEDGTVAEIYVSEGQSVEAGFMLLKVE